MLGILTEKPSAARNFAKALGGFKGVYDGEDYVIVNAAGHLYEYVVPSEQVPSAYTAKYKDWSVSNLPWDETLFAWKRVKKKGAGATLQSIFNALSKCDEIAIATDVDPTGEGQLLAWEILNELKLTSKKISRFYFMDESVKEIQKAFTTRKVLPPMSSDPDFMKAEFRTQWDMLSMQFTRIATACVGKTAVLRQGRLKSVMVKIVGDGLKAVKEYKKVPFYMNKFRDNNSVIYTNKEEPSFPTKDEVPKSYSTSGVVVDSKDMKYTAPPKLLDLATLSSRLASQGFKAKDVLDTYQKMYEKQIVSYPRTEDSVITPEQFNDLLPLIDKIADVVGVDKSLLTHRTPRKTHVKTGGAHGANRPGNVVPQSLGDLTVYGESGPLIYELLARSYLAMLAEDYEYEQQKGHLEKYPKFVGVASIPKKMGWKSIFDDGADVDENDNNKGLGTDAQPFIAEGSNPKPPTPTMKWLMKQLEKHDVGTGATRTSTYAEVTSESARYPLLTEKRGKLNLTEYGDMSYTLVRETYIGDVKTTELLQQQMRDIAEKKVKASDCLKMVQEYVKHDIEVMRENAKELKGGFSNTKEKYKGIWKGKPVQFSRVWAGHTFTDEECKALCDGETIVVEGLISQKTNRPYAVKGRLAELEYQGRKYIGFENLGFASTASTPTSDENGVPFSWCKKVFTQDERELLAEGRTVFVEGYVSKAGKKFSANTTFDKDTKKISLSFD